MRSIEDTRMTGVLGLGKISRKVFNRSVLPYIPIEKAIELDGATTNLSGNIVIAHAPSIGVPIEALGFFSFHYSASNVASKFGKPSNLISGIYLPLKTTEEELKTIVKSLGDEARKYGVTITAGQTATYYGLELPLLTATCIGERKITPENISPEDKVCLVGKIGGEAVWLDKLSRGECFEEWRSFTPLPAILALQKVSGVKLIHDVSEGGVKGALFEISTSNGFGLDISSKGVTLYDEAEKLAGDIMRAPSYSAVIIVTKENSVEEIKEKCTSLDLPCTEIGVITAKPGLWFDGQQINELDRIDIDEIYGRFTQKDSIIDEIKDAVERLISIKNLVRLIPEVGMNIIYAKPNACNLDEVAGLSGRIIKSMGEPLSCGKVAYGASRFLSSVVIEAMKMDSSKRSAINIRGGNDIEEKLESLGLDVTILPSKIEGDGCPVAIHLRSSDRLCDAYIHPGDFGVEPTTTILGSNPGVLVDLIEKLVKSE